MKNKIRVKLQPCRKKDPRMTENKNKILEIIDRKIEEKEEIEIEEIEEIEARE